jgi:hypothetical protein
LPADNTRRENRPLKYADPVGATVAKCRRYIRYFAFGGDRIAKIL